MQAQVAREELLQLIEWIEQHTSGLEYPTDERTLLSVGCFDVAIEHQAAIALLDQASLHGSAFALLRVLTESLVRGLWLHTCATEAELQKFKRGKLDKKFATLVEEVESAIATPSGVLSKFKTTAWDSLNGFTHTGFHQVSRRHAPGKIQGNYPEEEIAKALGVAGALGLITAGQLIAMSNKAELVPQFEAKLNSYGNPSA